MPREDVIQVVGTVVEVLPNTLCGVELANGHRFLARLSRQMRAGQVRLEPGNKVAVEMSPFDMSKGCITARDNQF